ncbi:hypothetical protein PENANT_c038G05681 [Penicillium antarcticum]|uniref:Uncharacterized protein n=1 Tax=Penicillium antarcticum TaxID=416450 RepID=A0A1V6PT78_9EURO|nr:hypothetical protein PENANT_c038G05681 [Penicillium antarcticum]
MDSKNNPLLEDHIIRKKLRAVKNEWKANHAPAAEIVQNTFKELGKDEHEEYPMLYGFNVVLCSQLHSAGQVIPTIEAALLQVDLNFCFMVDQKSTQ